MIPLAAWHMAGALPVLGILALLAVLIFLHELGHFLAAKALGIPVRQFAIGFGPALVARQMGETQYRINVLPLGGYCAFADDQAEADEEPQGDSSCTPIPPEHYLRNRPLWQRAVVVSAGVAANVLIAWVAVAIQIGWEGIPEEKILDTRQVGILVTAVLGQPAKDAGLREGDHVLALDGTRLGDTQAFQDHVRAAAGRTVRMTIVRDTPGAAARPLELVAHPGSNGKIGVSIAQPVEVTYRPLKGPVELVVAASDRTWRITRAMASGLWLLFTRQLPMDMVGGPIAIVHMGATTVKTFSQLCTFAAMISLDLAIVNFLPVPGLDGGHMLFILMEAIARRRLPRRVEETILQTGLLLLLGLGVMLIVKDIVTLGFHRG